MMGVEHLSPLTTAGKLGISPRVSGGFTNYQTTSGVFSGNGGWKICRSDAWSGKWPAHQ